MISQNFSKILASSVHLFPRFSITSGFLYLEGELYLYQQVVEYVGLQLDLGQPVT